MLKKEADPEIFNPFLADCYSRESKCYLEMGRLDSAMISALEALKEDKRDSRYPSDRTLEYLTQVSNLYLLMGQNELSEKCL